MLNIISSFLHLEYIKDSGESETFYYYFFSSACNIF